MKLLRAKHRDTQVETYGLADAASEYQERLHYVRTMEHFYWCFSLLGAHIWPKGPAHIGPKGRAHIGPQGRPLANVFNFQEHPRFPTGALPSLG